MILRQINVNVGELLKRRKNSEFIGEKFFRQIFYVIFNNTSENNQILIQKFFGGLFGGVELLNLISDFKKSQKNLRKFIRYFPGRPQSMAVADSGGELKEKFKKKRFE